MSLRHGLTEGAPGGRGQRAKEAARRREEQRQELIRMRDAARRAQAQQSAAAAAAAVAGAGAQTGRAEEAADRPEGEVLRPTGLQVFTKHQSQMQEALPRAALAPPSAADKVHSEAAAEREARGARDRPLQHRNGWERQLGSEGEERRAAVLAAGQRQRDRAVRSWRPPAPCSRTRAAGGRKALGRILMGCVHCGVRAEWEGMGSAKPRRRRWPRRASRLSRTANVLWSARDMSPCRQPSSSIPALVPPPHTTKMPRPALASRPPQHRRPSPPLLFRKTCAR
jgi:hypothetical protein